jgi:hypothetical protein
MPQEREFLQSPLPSLGSLGGLIHLSIRQSDPCRVVGRVHIEFALHPAEVAMGGEYVNVANETRDYSSEERRVRVANEITVQSKLFCGCKNLSSSMGRIKCVVQNL